LILRVPDPDPPITIRGGMRMGSSEGKVLAELIRQKSGEFSRLFVGLDEATASRAPSGRWSPKEILSHAAGPEGAGLTAAIRSFLEHDTPTLDMEPANPFFTGNRPKMTVAELLQEVKAEYSRIADIVGGLSDEQLARKAHIPAFKDTPLGEYLTLAVFVRAMTEHHLDFHIGHAKEIIEALGAGKA
jgi:hypothetical protein